MSPRGYLSFEQLNNLAAAIYQAVQYPAPVRSLLLRGLPFELRGMMSGGGLELIGLKLDLEFLNYIERLADGSVPLKTFLRNVIDLGGVIEALTIARELLADLEIRTTGASRLIANTLPETKERIVGGHNDMVSFAFMQSGIVAAQSVVKLEVPRFGNGEPHMTRGEQSIYLGTGWLIAPNLLITNHHVFNARNEAEPAAEERDLKLQTSGTTARFDFDFQAVAGTAVSVGALLAWDPDLDYAIARVDDLGRKPLTLAAAPLAITGIDSHIAVNIVQHPNGDSKKFGIRNNMVTAVSEKDVRYFTDTEGGSSGSPVFDDNWHVVALHRGSAFARNVQYQGRAEAFVNVGTCVFAIRSDLRARFPGLV